ncbi:NADPH cytochrome P450 oxidoreductase family protein [Aspergillus stella-maris]|uniref:NADPH cytochrome P450 oxidoreductase family protein n=1 Tax=Aspergillus stella-maris TaxID=1810926 RepID=UPI003CCDD651
MASLLTLQTQPAGTADYVALTFLSLVGATFLSRGILWDQPDPYRHLLFERPQLKNGGTAASQDQQTRNIARRMEETNSSIVVFWGSQSGTAESFAHRLAREITLRFGQTTLTADLSDYDPSSVAEIPASKLAIFILSTYGEGDPADNTVDFWDWLNSNDRNQEKPKKQFSDLRYFAFGLGNSNYKFYNKVIDRVVEVLDTHGANALLPVSKANDANGTTQEDFISWKEKLFTFFRESLGFKQQEMVYQPTITVDSDDTIEASALHRGDPRHASNPTAIPISGIRQLFEPTSDRHCLHIDLDISSTPDLVYKTGDHLAVWPSNPDQEVNLLLQMLGRANEADTPLNIAAIEGADGEDISRKVLSPTTLLVLLRHYLEITAQLPRDILATLAPFAPTSEAKTFLNSLATNKEAYADFTKRNHLTLARVLAASSGAAQWTSLPLSYILETLPSLQPRYYSISSSSVVTPRKIALTVLVLSTPLADNAAVSIPGLTSTYLLSLADTPTPNNKNAVLPTYTNTLLPVTNPSPSSETTKTNRKILAHLRRSTFKLPRLTTAPLILIAAGTGLAPFRAFLSERRQLLKIGRDIGPMILFFGCRRPDEDFIYKAELDEMKAAFGDKLSLVTAFSRDPGSKRAYVQDAIIEHKETLVDLLVEQRGNLYICGRAGMAREVERRVTGEILQGVKGWAEKESEEWVRGIKRRNKWQEDVWG